MDRSKDQNEAYIESMIVRMEALEQKYGIEYEIYV